MEKVQSFLLPVILMFFGQVLFAQNKPVTYSNRKNAYYHKDTSNNIKEGPLKGLEFLEAKINGITLNPDSTYEMVSQPNISCFTWAEYKGTWKKQKDTILLSDSYEVVENDVRTTYKKNSEQVYHITFHTDKKSELKNKQVKVEYEYDITTHLKSFEKLFYLDTNNEIEIPFQDVPDRSHLAAISIEYLLNDNEKRWAYLTENKIANIKDGDLANIIGVELVENPKSEIVHRTINCLVQNNIMTILFTIKSKISLPDYHPEIMFEKSYALDN